MIASSKSRASNTSSANSKRSAISKDQTRIETIKTFEQEIKARKRAARETLAKAATIDPAVFDLKAVNPDAVARTDTRTPAKIIASIEAGGEIVSAALSNLKKLLAEAD